MITLGIMFEEATKRLMARWFACRITSSRKSVQYGLRFSYPLYISLVAVGTFLTNPYILSTTLLLAFFGVILPMHPFDYVYNHIVTKLIGIKRIAGRGSELQINSIAALIFNFFVLAAIIFGIQLNYSVMALVYVASSVFFIAILLLKDNFS